MGPLSAIRDAVQKTAKAVSSIIGTDVVVVDSDLTPVAATRPRIETKLGFAKGCLSERLIHGKWEHILSIRNANDLCRACEGKSGCTAKCVLMSPIKSPNGVLGVIGLEAWDEKQSAILLGRRQELYQFMIELSSLLAAKVEESRLLGQLHCVSEKSGGPVGGKLAGLPQASVGAGRIGLDHIRGRSRVMVELLDRARKVVNSNSSVLIRGETGTGKELLARAIHGESVRRSGPFVPINCAAIPEPLLESELFGYEEGAFTGARKGGKPGKFEVAGGGTLFLDEVGDMPMVLQAKILRVVQEKRIDRVGGRTSIPIDVRVMAATHRNLEKMVEEGAFRADLYYRLNVIELSIPSLRERREDIPDLLDYFLERASAEVGKEVRGFSPQAMDTIRRYPWPGNVRELENAVEYAANMEETCVIGVSSLPPQISRFYPTASVNPKGRLLVIPELNPNQLLLRMLDHYGTSTEGKKKAARALGISTATLYRRLQKLK